MPRENTFIRATPDRGYWVRILLVAAGAVAASALLLLAARLRGLARWYLLAAAVRVLSITRHQGRILLGV